MKELQLVTKACCIPACQALPLLRLFLRGQGNCLSQQPESKTLWPVYMWGSSHQGQQLWGLHTQLPLERQSTQGRGSRGDRSQRGGLGGKVFREGAGDCEGAQLWLGIKAGWEGENSKSNLLLLSLGAPQKLLSGG